MKKQLLLKQFCGLSIVVAGALVPLSSVHAADELSDRYLNGYLNDPYTNEVAPDTYSVLQSGEQTGSRGAEGPIRDDAGMFHEKPMAREGSQRDVPLELYTGYIGDETSWRRGAEGPIRDDSGAFVYQPMKRDTQRFDLPRGDLYDPPYPKSR